MRKPFKTFFALFPILCVSFCVISCSKMENEAENASASTNNEVEWVLLSKACNKFFCSHDTLSLTPFQDYLNSEIYFDTRSEGNGSRTIVEFDSIAFKSFCHKYSLCNDEDLYLFLLANADRISELIESSCSSKFSQYFEKASNLFTENMENDFYKSVYESDELSITEKGLLILIGVSENLHAPQTRSVSSCMKRYTKLTVIAVKTLLISGLDIQAGNDYAVRELKNMGKEYDC